MKNSHNYSHNAKAFFTILRLIKSVGLIILGIALMIVEFNWRDWCPDHEVFIVPLLFLIGIAIISIMYGVYSIKPIFWKFRETKEAIELFPEEKKKTIREYKAFHRDYWNKYLW